MDREEAIKVLDKMFNTYDELHECTSGDLGHEEMQALQMATETLSADRPKIAYFCDGTACDGECDECHHTTDIEHAKNFNIINGMHNIKYIETDYRPRGEWIMHIDDLYPEDSTQECSNCHEHETIRIYNDNYCPNCGAKMGSD